MIAAGYWYKVWTQKNPPMMQSILLDLKHFMLLFYTCINAYRIYSKTFGGYIAGQVRQCLWCSWKKFPNGSNVFAVPLTWLLTCENQIACQFPANSGSPMDRLCASEDPQLAWRIDKPHIAQVHLTASRFYLRSTVLTWLWSYIT